MSLTDYQSSQEERANRYPSRFIVPPQTKLLTDYKAPDVETLDESVSWAANLKWVAAKHYHAVECKEDGRICLGDVVALNAAESTEFFMRVDELFEDPDGEKMFSGQYFYQPEETVMGHYIPLSKKSKEGVDSSKKKVQVPQIAGRLFLAADEDNKTYNLVHSLDSVNRKVIVHRVKPGNRVPPLKDNSEYWFDQCHSTKHFVFRDYYERGEEPDFVKLPSHTTLRVLELCSGAGGTSFLCQAAKMNGKTIHLKSCWAIDIAEDANATFEINEPECFVYNIGIDEALMLSMIWETDVLSKYGPKTKASSGKSSDVIVEIIDVKLCDSAVRGTSGQSKGHLLNNLERDQCWIEYLCVMREKGTIFATDRLEDEVRWIMDSEMPPCEKEMRDFVALERAQCRIPVRGDVDIIMGGPPCQGLSGLNRNAARIDILKDPKNRLVMVYYDIVRWFEPRFTVMEQVLDAFKKENALYARFMASAITALRYQCRIGIIAAGDHGCPQGRYRVITWSAKQGMPLPQFPEPSHRCLDFKTPVPEVAKKCLVVFKSKMSLKASYPMTVNGDILEDLPPVGNFSFSDGLSYASACTRPWQIFVRRKPPSGSPSAVARAKAASQLMSALDIKRLLYLMALHDQKPARLGFEFFCGRRPIPNEQLKTDDVGEEQDKIEVGESDDREDEEEGEEGEEEAECVNPAKENEEDELATIGESELKVESNFARQTWRALLKTIKDHDMRVIVNNQRESTANAYAEQMGEMIYGEVVKAIESIERTQGLKEGEEELRDHRPLNNNLDDYERMARIPSFKGASFRNMPGVVVNENRSTCVGHCHAYSSKLSCDTKEEGKAPAAAQLNAKTKTGCSGGGTIKDLVRSTSKHSRIDQHDKNGWRGTILPGCTATTHWLPSGDLVCPRWCITYQGGKSGTANSRQSCFGRVWYDEVQPTVVTRAEPHNLRIVHPTQDRVLSIRENARAQGFPDYWALVGMDSGKNSGSNRSGSVSSRYAQIGNAVAPPVARKLGLALIYSLTVDPAKTTFHGTMEDESVVAVRDPEMDAAYDEAKRLGLQSYAEEHGLDEKELSERIARFEEKEKLHNAIAQAERLIAQSLRSMGAILPSEVEALTSRAPASAKKRNAAAAVDDEKEQEDKGKGKRARK